MVLIGMGDESDRARTRFAIGDAIAKLPEADYAIETWPEGALGTEIALGYLFSLYVFSRYRTQSAPKARLSAPAHLDAARLERIATGEALTRDLINTPAEDMGPRELEHAVHDLAELHGATVTGIHGDSLLDANLPLIHTVGTRQRRGPAPDRHDMGRGRSTPDPCGQGRLFRHRRSEPQARRVHGPDEEGHGRRGERSGPGAHDHGQRPSAPLRVLIPAVENAVAGNAFRPGDILTARDGKTIEINNTDAEGRLVLADALALAAEDDARPPGLHGDADRRRARGRRRRYRALLHR
jgi:leucyl aminopeptidase